MKKALIFILALSCAGAARAEEVMINNKEAKIRNGPGKNYTVIWKPRLYTPMEVLAKHAEWYAVRDVEGDVGWLHESVVAKDPAAIVTEKVVNVHESPDSSSAVAYQAPKNYTFKVEEEKEGWLKVVDPDGDQGWIAKKGIWTGTSAEGKAAETKAKESKSASKKEHKEHKKEKKKK